RACEPLMIRMDSLRCDLLGQKEIGEGVGRMEIPESSLQVRYGRQLGRGHGLGDRTGPLLRHLLGQAGTAQCQQQDRDTPLHDDCSSPKRISQNWSIVRSAASTCWKICLAACRSLVKSSM